MFFANFIILWFFFAFKYNVGTDSVNYLRIYDKAKYIFQQHGEFWFPSQEPLYYLLNLFSAVNGLGTLFIYSICGLLISYFTINSARILDINPYSFLALVFPFHIVMMAISGIRQGVAESIIYFAFSLLYIGKKKLFAFYVVLASGFHVSAIFFLPLYFIDMKKRYLAMAFLFILPVVILGGDSEYGHYLDSGLFNQGVVIRLGFLAACTLALIGMLRRESTCLSNREKNLAIFLILSLPMQIALAYIQTTIADRLSYYFIGLSALAYLRLSARGGDKFWVLPSLVFLGFLALLVFLTVGSNGASYYYDSYIFHLFSGDSFLI